MTKTENWPARVIYILVALALAVGLLLSPALTSVSADESEWERFSTPTGEDWKVAPQSTIFAYAAMSGATQLYMNGRGLDVDDLVESYNVTPSDTVAHCDEYIIPQLWASDTYGCTWKAITKNLLKGIEEDLGPDYALVEINYVTMAPLNADFVVVAIIVNNNGTIEQHVMISDDGGTTFAWTGDLPVPAAAGPTSTTGPEGTLIMSMFCTFEVDDDVRNIGVGGVFDPDGLTVAALPMSTPHVANIDGDEVGVFDRLETGGLFGSWKDVTNPATYPGWDNINDDVGTGNDLNNNGTVAVTTVWWGPDFGTAEDVMAICHVDTDGNGFADATYMQYGAWGSTKAWNMEAGFSEAILIVNDGSLWFAIKGAASGISPPVDWNSRYASKRYNWVHVNVVDVSKEFAGESVTNGGIIYRLVDDAVDPIIMQIPDLPLVAAVRYWGFIESGKAIAGVVGNGKSMTEPPYDYSYTDCCEGVQVWRNNAIEDMEICCKGWKDACKPPSGVGIGGAGFVSDNLAVCGTSAPGMSYDESAFSISLDDGDTWNQVGMIDTEIDYLSDMAVSPDCNKTYLLSINKCSTCHSGSESRWDNCDSVWLHADELPEDDRFSGCWIRVWHGGLVDFADPDACGDIGCAEAHGILRLSPDETTGETIYMANRGTDVVWYNGEEGLTCWEKGEANVDEIVDLAVKDEATVYALDIDGKVSWSDDHGFPASWEDEVDSKLDAGHTIAVKGDHILVGGIVGDVSYSDDGGETFTELDSIACCGCVHVAFDSHFDDNSTIYAALTGSDAQIARWVIDESDDWEDLDAKGASDGFSYHGIVVDNPDGNPMTDASTGCVLYATYVQWDDDDSVYRTGVARILNPAEELCCADADWDYLEAGLEDCEEEEFFDLEPSSLKICGCLTADSNTHLFAIDNSGDGYYDSCCDCMWDDEDCCCVTDWEDCDCACIGRVWTYEDCFSKGAPDLVSIADGSMVPADECYCINEEIVLKWERMCNACSYDIQIALDDDFVEIIDEYMEYEPAKGDAPSLVIGEGALDCNETYYWRVRAADAETDEIIHSWWSSDEDKPWSFTVEVGPAGAIELTAPDNGVTNVPVTRISFTWTGVPDVTTYDWVLSANADLSSPVESKTGLTGTAYSFTGTLDNNGAYYWRVTAKKDGVVVSQSQISTFTTVPEKAPPPAEPEPAKTPTWVWVIIAIGAVLVIVVIVLIFRTRRV